MSIILPRRRTVEIALLLMISFFIHDIAMGQAYPAFSATSPWSHYIKGVSGVGFDNSDQGSLSMTKSSSTGGYADYTSSPAFQMTGGETVDLTFDLVGKHWNAISKFGYLYVWIDLNGDGDFLDAGELVLNEQPEIVNQNVETSSVHTYSFDIPTVSSAINTRVRTVFTFDQPSLPEDAITSVNRGEGEDYLVSLTPGSGNEPPPPPPPPPPTTNCDTTLNLALGQYAYQTSTSGPGKASNAVDGQRSVSMWGSSPGATQTNWSSQAYLQIDLGADYDIGLVKVFNSPDGNKTGAFQVFVTSDTSVFDSGWATYSTNSSILLGDSPVCEYPTDIRDSITGRYVRVQIPGQGFLALGEVEVYGCTVGGGNQPAPPQAPRVVISPQDPTCPNATDGSVRVLVTGGTAPYSYLWEDGSTLVDRSQLGVGVYSVSVTDAQGLTNESTRELLPSVPFCPGGSAGSTTPSRISIDSSLAYSSSHKSGFEIRKALDGNYTAWNSAFNSEWREDASATINLGQEWIIDSIIIHAPSSGNVSQNLYVMTLVGAPPVALADARAAANWEVFYKDDVPGLVSIGLPADTHADHIRFQRDGMGFVVLREIYVVAHLEGGPSQTITADRIAWDRIPPNLRIEGDVIFKGNYDEPQEKLRGCNVLDPNENGTLQFTLVSDPGFDREEYYVGFVDASSNLNNIGTQDAQVLIKIDGSVATGESIQVTSNGGTIYTSGSGFEHNVGDWYQVRREGASFAVYRNGELIVRFDNGHPSLPAGKQGFATLTLKPLLNIRSAGNDGQLVFDHVVSPGFTCPTPYADVRVDAYPTAGSPAQVQVTPISNSDLQFLDGELMEVGEIAPGTYSLGYHEPGYDSLQSVWLPEVGRPIFQSKTTVGALLTVADSLVYTGGDDKESISVRAVSVDSGILARLVINEDILPASIDPNADNLARFRFYLRDASLGIGSSFTAGTYGFEISPQELRVVYNNTLPGIQSSTDDKKFNFSGYTYDVIIREGVFKLLKNGTEVYQNPVDPSITEYRLVVEAFGPANQFESDVEIYLSQPTTPEPVLEQYVALKQEFDGSVVKADDNTFRFFVRERYNVVEAPLQVALTDPDGHLFSLSTSTDHHYGDNLHELPLALHRNGVYYMEITEPNKGTVYKQMFYWECPASSTCISSY